MPFLGLKRLDGSEDPSDHVLRFSSKVLRLETQPSLEERIKIFSLTLNEPYKSWAYNWIVDNAKMEESKHILKLGATWDMFKKAFLEEVTFLVDKDELSLQLERIDKGEIKLGHLSVLEYEDLGDDGFDLEQDFSNDDPEDYITMMEFHLGQRQISKLEEQVNFVTATLERRNQAMAEVWMDENLPRNSEVPLDLDQPTWDGFRRYFIQFFRPSFTWENELRSYRQQKDICMREYVQRKRKIMNKVDPSMDGRKQVLHILKGLNDHYYQRAKLWAQNVKELYEQLKWVDYCELDLGREFYVEGEGFPADTKTSKGYREPRKT